MTARYRLDWPWLRPVAEVYHDPAAEPPVQQLTCRECGDEFQCRCDEHCPELCEWCREWDE